MEQFSERFMDHVRQVCTFAKLIPGFKCLHHDDQVTLLKSCVFEVLLVRLAGLFDNQVRKYLTLRLCSSSAILTQQLLCALYYSPIYHRTKNREVPKQVLKSNTI
jgi:hypothetical protein